MMNRNSFWLLCFCAFLSLLLGISFSGCGSGSSADNTFSADQISQLEHVFNVKTEVKQREIAFQTENQDDPTIEQGVTVTKQVGVKGSRVITTVIFYLFDNEVMRMPVWVQNYSAPINQIVAVGSMPIAQNVPANNEQQSSSASQTHNTGAASPTPAPSAPTPCISCGLPNNCGDLGHPCH